MNNGTMELSKNWNSVLCTEFLLKGNYQTFLLLLLPITSNQQLTHYTNWIMMAFIAEVLKH